ncbi:MAG: SLC13 family permease [Porticoccaceae bacterium]|nr:SLC13 family permease [Porticoccaceae bacterium]
MSQEIIIILGLLIAAVILFIKEWFPVDVSALAVLVVLGLLNAVPQFDLMDANDLFMGFASNAVISIIGITIIGYALDKTGLMQTIARWISSHSKSEKGALALICSAVGTVSGFMQNIGAAAIFIPIVSRVASTNGVSFSRLLMPMGFAAILGGTVTMVGSGPLILLNDLLPEGTKQFDLFSVTPIGMSILVAGIVLFVLAGKWLLPAGSPPQEAQGSLQAYRSLYGVEGEVHQLVMAQDCALRAKTVGEVEEAHGIHMIALIADELILSPHRDIELNFASRFAVVGSAAAIEQFVALDGIAEEEDERLANALDPSMVGVAEMVVRPGGAVAGKTIREIRIRKTYGMTPLAIYRGDQVLRDNLRDVRLQVGDTILGHICWKNLSELEADGSDFGVITQVYPKAEHSPEKLITALLIFGVAIGFIIFSDLKLSLVLMTAALGMVVSGVINMDQAYQAVSWKTVFLLASLIPLGSAMQHTGTAAWLADHTVSLLGDKPSLLMLQITIALLATVLSLVMSNVGATVILVPLAAEIANQAGFDGRLFALLVAVCVSNSFILPTHQVNALIMSPGGYRVNDFMRAGGAMTVLFIVVTITALNLFY